MSTNRAQQRDSRMVVALTLVILACPAAMFGVAALLRDRLPDPIAIHWGLGGADGFASLHALLVLASALAVIPAAALGAAAVRSSGPALPRRLLVGVATWNAVFVTAVVVDSLRVQVGVAEAGDAPSPVVGLVGGALLAAAAAAAVAASLKDAGAEAKVAAAPPPPDAPRAPDPTGTWSRRLTTPRALLWLLAVAAGLVAVLAAVFSWWLLGFIALIGLPIAALAGTTVTVDGSGLTARVLGAQLLHVPPRSVAEARVVPDLDPFWEFGGWGLRVDLGGRTAIVDRRGPAVRIMRGDGSHVFVTTDDPEHVAGILNTAADRAHANPN